MSDPTLSRPWWRWMEGMRTACGLRVYSAKPPLPLGIREGDQRARPECGALPHDAVPDITDPATIGCLTHRARELHDDPGLYVCPRLNGPGWFVIGSTRVLGIEGPTEWAALVAACDAAAGGEA